MSVTALKVRAKPREAPLSARMQQKIFRFKCSVLLFNYFVSVHLLDVFFCFFAMKHKIQKNVVNRAKGRVLLIERAPVCQCRLRLSSLLVYYCVSHCSFKADSRALIKKKANSCVPIKPILGKIGQIHFVNLTVFEYVRRPTT